MVSNLLKYNVSAMKSGLPKENNINSTSKSSHTERNISPFLFNRERSSQAPENDNLDKDYNEGYNLVGSFHSSIG